MDTAVAELVTFFQAIKGGSLFVLAPVLIGLALTIAAVAYQVIAIRRFQAASKATQENFETIAADLRKRALEVKKQDEGLRKRDLEAKERDEFKGFVKDANAELTEQPQRSQQQQVLKGSRRALKESVSQIIVVGLEDIQSRMLQTDLGMTSVVFDNPRSAFSGWAADRGRSSLTSWVGGPARQ
jgi:multidrug resistance efflux pump